MSLDSADQSHACEICAVVGLPILPLRYALAWAGDEVPANKRAPQLSGPFSASAYPSLDATEAHYTLRVLRGGYLYTYDEARREWSAYEVSEGGILFVFDADEGPGAGDRADTVKCSRAPSPSLGRCIQVKDPAKAGKLWLAHSDTRWTAAVKEKHADAAYRARHMRCIDVGAWFRSAGGQSQPHLGALKDVFSQVSEYALEPAPTPFFDYKWEQSQSKTAGVETLGRINAVPEPAFVFLPYEFSARPRDDFRGLLVQAHPDAPLPQQPYAMVALDDPVGITTEVAALMSDRLEGFMTEPERVRPMAASAAIMQMRDAVEQQAVLQAASRMEYGELSEYEVRRQMAAGTYVAQVKPKYTAQDLKLIGEQAWSKAGCAERYDEAARRAWQDVNDAELKALYEKVIAPLAAVHVTLLESIELSQHLQCNHDPQDAQSGVAYLGVTVLCIGDTQDQISHADLYARWLDGSPQDVSNLLLRAFALNQEHLATEIVKAVDEAGNIKLEELPWSYLFGIYNGALSVGGDRATALAAHWIEKTLGPVAGMLSKATDGVAKPYALLAWAMATNLQLERVELKGQTSFALIREVRRTMLTFSGVKMSHGDVRSHITRLQVLGLNTAHIPSDVAFIGVRKDASLVSGAHYRAEHNRFISNKLGTWRSVMDSDLRAGLGGSLLSAVALGVLYKKATESMLHEREESWQRVVLSAVSLVGAATEMVGKKLERIGNLSPRFAKFAPIGNGVARIGQRVSAFGGMLMGVLDIYRAGKEIARRNYKMGALYFLSGGAALGLSFAILALNLLWTGVFFVIVVAVAIAMMVWADGAHHAWLDRCWWGRLKAERYLSDDVEMQQYQLAMEVV